MSRTHARRHGTPSGACRSAVTAYARGGHLSERKSAASGLTKSRVRCRHDQGYKLLSAAHADRKERSVASDSLASAGMTWPRGCLITSGSTNMPASSSDHCAPQAQAAAQPAV